MISRAASATALASCALVLLLAVSTMQRRGAVATSAQAPTVLALFALNAPISAADYDDDPLGNPGHANRAFYVAPAVDLTAIRRVNAYVWADGSAGGAVHLALRFGGPDGPIVAHQVGAVANRAASCAGEAADADTSGTTAHGIVTTGQAARAELDALAQRCLQGSVRVAAFGFPVSRHLPPGAYSLCAAVEGSAAAQTPYCTPFFVVAVRAYSLDLLPGSFDFGDLRSGQRSAITGDFVLGSARPTLANNGNVPFVIRTEFERLSRGAPATATLDGRFEIEVLLRDATGSVGQRQRVADLRGNIRGASATVGNTPERATLDGVCIQPSQIARIDVAVTPLGPIEAGAYHGVMTLAAIEREGCQATLDAGETAWGDDNIYDNAAPGTGLVVTSGPFAPRPAPTPTATPVAGTPTATSPTGTAVTTASPAPPVTPTLHPSATATSTATPLAPATITATPGR